ncbi:uncharacterized protein CIMG_11168 [Coccidioides immitis RS]|uniref:Uncharacterized protein n=1 Tax=Coccidioides immitis (strain RS) TaxID=246410 RepID=A0A0D8JX78_COCIM|nr:uncharacterized protein CIMG_11168 [Coccidioides immitis RS]KJF61541.1 hypothetical protein CIMG_11168 [Coccidioides immitis RS]
MWVSRGKRGLINAFKRQGPMHYLGGLDEVTTGRREARAEAGGGRTSSRGAAEPRGGNPRMSGGLTKRRKQRKREFWGGPASVLGNTRHVMVAGGRKESESGRAAMPSRNRRDQQAGAIHGRKSKQNYK